MEPSLNLGPLIYAIYLQMWCLRQNPTPVALLWKTISLLNSLLISSLGGSLLGGVSGEFSRDKLDGFEQIIFIKIK